MLSIEVMTASRSLNLIGLTADRVRSYSRRRGAGTRHYLGLGRLGQIMSHIKTLTFLNLNCTERNKDSHNRLQY